ncbi:ATP-binding cassette domain-containing protein [uncultured Acetatifactor sp.]|uniref:ATP-binding cassette domain-containing protein n=1 Tax=uncultured Acetatifactor sp. TaxID=1671927 RepID=UPI002609B2FF|nr:ATP-binding cassette domain-containing protein [uncultured Acetatifactor sp.]
MMNQIKIGAFISERRKAKGWTQSQLAEKLEITDKAVSKWETGRSMPDLSLFMPLCTLLDVTLNELFAGERIAEEKWKERADEVLMDVITNWLGHDNREKVHSRESKESDTTPENVLEVENVSKLYENVSTGHENVSTGHENVSTGHETENNSVLAVKDISFQIPQGSFVGIMGASGSGKTTLLNLIATIDKPTNGTIRISGQNIVDIPDEAAAEFRRRHLGFVFQEYNLLETLTIYENIALALTIKEVPKESILPTIQSLSEKLDISAILDKFPYEVSGGQRQRCACARAIVVNPDIILADEPTGALDSHAARQLLDTLVMLCREYGATILMVTHDVMAASYCDRILFMKDGEIKAALNREQENKQTFFADILKKIEWMGGES